MARRDVAISLPPMVSGQGGDFGDTVAQPDCGGWSSTRRCHIITSGQPGSASGGSCMAMPSPTAANRRATRVASVATRSVSATTNGATRNLRQAQDDVTFEAERGQLAVYEAHAVAFGRDEEVWGGCERLQTRALREGRMALPRDAREAFMEKRVDQDASRGLDGNADREVRLAFVEQIESLGSAEDTAHPHIEAGASTASSASSGGNRTKAA